MSLCCLSAILQLRVKPTRKCLQQLLECLTMVGLNLRSCFSLDGSTLWESLNSCLKKEWVRHLPSRTRYFGSISSRSDRVHIWGVFGYTCNVRLLLPSNHVPNPTTTLQRNLTNTPCHSIHQRASTKHFDHPSNKLICSRSITRTGYEDAISDMRHHLHRINELQDSARSSESRHGFFVGTMIG